MPAYKFNIGETVFVEAVRTQTSRAERTSSPRKCRNAMASLNTGYGAATSCTNALCAKVN